MKKTYSKPEIMFEDFTLSTNIASCGKKIDAPSSGNCGYKVQNDFTTNIIFVSKDTGCDTFETDDEYDGICYYTFAGSSNGAFFNS